MAKLGQYEIHPFADKFPLIGGEEFDELVADVKEHGLRDPILLSADGKVLIDGRNRYRACEAAGSTPRFKRLESHYDEAKILDLIVSLNVERRHLDAGTRAFLALDYKAAYAEAAKAAETARKINTPSNQHAANGSATLADRPESSGAPTMPARPQPRGKRTGRASEPPRLSALQAGASSARKAVQRDRPDLADKVRSGEMALDAADRQRRQWARSQPKPEPVAPGPVPLILRTHDGQEFPYPQPKGKATFNQTPGEGISWAEWSWNPVTGCLHGCDYCYAREIATSDRLAPYYPAGFTPLFHHERLDAPRNTTIPAAHAEDDPAWHRVFVCSMADLYGRWVPDEWIQQVHASMLASPQWQYILLTKFPDRYVGLDMPPGAWVGTSVDEQKRVRIAESAFREIDGVAVKWLSLEPLREPLEFTDLSMFDWVVIGAQTETRQPGKSSRRSPRRSSGWPGSSPRRARPGAGSTASRTCSAPTDPQLPGMQMPDEYPSPPRMRQGDLLAADY